MPELPLEELLGIEAPYRRRLAFTAIFQEALRAIGEDSAIVGGHAVEAYTAGNYTTADVDLVVFSKVRAAAILREWEFAQEGRIFWHGALGVAVDLIGERLAGDWKRVVTMEVAGHRAIIIGPEDLIIDRLNACVHWQSSDHCDWAEAILGRQAAALDLEYLTTRATEEGVREALARMLEKLDAANDPP